MKIWLDALTPKQLLFLNSLASKLRENGHGTLLTIRRGERTEELARNMCIEHKVVGEHGYTIEEKLRNDTERIKRLLELVEEYKPDTLVSYPNPTAVRTAFGLSIPVIIYTDTPHAMHAHRLSLPLSDYVVVSSFIKRESIIRYMLSSYTRLIRYKGVEELAWIRGFRPDEKNLREYELEPYQYIVARPPEIHASYYKWGEGNIFNALIGKLSGNTRILLIPRYREDVNRFKDKNITVMRRAVPMTNIIYYSAATITGGGTMARESALLGVPGIDLFPGKLEINERLAQLGFPLYRRLSMESLLELLYKIIGRPEKYRRDTGNMIRSMVHPIEPLLTIMGGWE